MKARRKSWLKGQREEAVISFCQATPLDLFLYGKGHFLKYIYSQNRVKIRSGEYSQLHIIPLELTVSCVNPAFLFHVKHFLSSFKKDAPGGLRRRLRDVEVRDELFDVGQFLVEIFAALLLFPVAREFLQRKDRTVDTIFKTILLFFEQISPGMNKTSVN